MSYYRFIFNALLFFLTIPPLAIHPQAEVPSYEAIWSQTQNNKLLSYDDVMCLLKELEDGTLEKRCTENDLEKINLFLIFLARQGLLPYKEEEKAILEQDIKILLNSPDYERLSYEKDSDYCISHAVLYEPRNIVLCSSWARQKWTQTKKFMKHGYREDSFFPKPTGNATQINAYGQEMLELILNHPKRKTITLTKKHLLLKFWKFIH